MFSHIECAITEVTQTSIKCTVTPVAGSWAPIVTDSMGVIPIDPSCPNISVPLVLTSVTNNTNLNPFGGTIL
jgi:hypothetical protein